MKMAQSASRIKICTAGNANDCITSVAGSDPIKALREGRTINWNGAVCDATCTALIWSGRPARVDNAVTACKGGISGNGEGALEGALTNGNCWGSGGNCLFQTSCNGNGLHVGLGDGSSCGWTASSSDNLEFFFDYTQPEGSRRFFENHRLFSKMTSDFSDITGDSWKITCYFLSKEKSLILEITGDFFRQKLKITGDFINSPVIFEKSPVIKTAKR